MKTITLLKSVLTLLVAVAITACDPTVPPPEKDGVIEGTITDNETGKPIVNATVSLILNSETLESLATEQDGKYKFESLIRNAFYTIKADADGYISKAKLHQMPTEENLVIDLALEKKNTDPVTEVPKLTTKKPSGEGYTQFYSGGTVTSANFGTITEWGVCYNTSPNPTIADNKATALIAGNSFEVTVKDLQSGTTYYVRAFATNEIGTGYGEECVVTTLKPYYESIDIPDENFLKALIDAGYDTSKDGKIQQTEANQIINLAVPECGIKSFEGVRLFKNLKTMDCSKNEASVLDVSGLALLEELKCSDMSTLSSLNIRGCTALKSLDFSQTAIEELELAAFKNLETLSLKKTPMTVLDVSECESLVNLDCSDSQLLSLLASELPKLKVVNVNGIVGMSSLSLTDNTSLTELYCNNTGISSLYVEGCGALIKLNAENTHLLSLGLSNCPLIEEVILNGSAFSSIDLSSNTKLKNFACKNNTTLSDIDLSYCDPESVDMTGCTSLTTIYVSSLIYSKVNANGEIDGWTKPAGATYSEF